LLDRHPKNSPQNDCLSRASTTTISFFVVHFPLFISRFIIFDILGTPYSLAWYFLFLTRDLATFHVVPLVYPDQVPSLGTSGVVDSSS
jgi:hypothetical protein